LQRDVAKKMRTQVKEKKSQMHEKSDHELKETMSTHKDVHKILKTKRTRALKSPYRNLKASPKNLKLYP
jgi:hypothetical protein